MSASLISISVFQNTVFAQENADGVTLPVEPVSMVHDVKNPSMIMSPKKQMTQNMDPHNVMCKEGLELILKDSNFSPACVTKETADKLVQRGWASSHLPKNDPMMKKMIEDKTMKETTIETTFKIGQEVKVPIIDGYYNGQKIFFIHSEVSDSSMAQMMSSMVNFPTLYTSELKNIPTEDLSKVYVFTNGIPGTEPYGGGPFMFQIDVFDSVPGENGYGQFRVPQLVSWLDGSNPRILTSTSEILEAQKNGEIQVQPTENVVNAPLVMWTLNGKESQASKISRIFYNMSEMEGDIMNVDVEKYTVTLKIISPDSMNKDDMMK